MNFLLKLNKEKYINYRTHDDPFIWPHYYLGLNPTNMNFGMFADSIDNLGSQEQIDAWLDKAMNMQMLGSYS